MKTIKKPLAAVAALIASIVAAFGQYTVLVDDSSNIIFPTNLASIPAAGLTGTAPTNVLPGALGTLSTWNGGGLLTNAAFPSVHWFTNQNTTTNWTIPTGAKSLYMRLVGHGGPGGSGRRGSAGTVIGGGSGGGGGAVAEQLISDVSKLSANVLVISIPEQKLGGGSVVTDDSNGTNGAAQSYTIVYVGSSNDTNIVIRAIGGSFGLAGDNNGSSGGAAGNVGLFAGTAGGASDASGGTGSTATQLLTTWASTGGGGGGGITTGSVPSSGGNGGAIYLTIAANSAPGGTAGNNGSSTGSSWPLNVAQFPLRGWPGAGGGGGQTNAVAGKGADGYGWGSGGGGGGGSLNGYASGAGGAGGPSAVVIVAY